MRSLVYLVAFGIVSGSCAGADPDSGGDATDTDVGTDADSEIDSDADTDDSNAQPDMGAIRLMLTITGRSLVHEGDCTVPNTENDSYGYYCGNWDVVRSAISNDGTTFYLEEPTWFVHGDIMDTAWGVAQDGTWQLISSTVVNGRLRYGEQAGCPYFPGSGNSGSPEDTEFREVLFEGNYVLGGAPNVNSVGAEKRVYYGGDEGIGFATVEDGQIVPYEGNPIITPSEFGIDGLIINDPTVTQRADGSFVMYVKGAGLPDEDPNPADHFLLRATSDDGISNWVVDPTPVVMGGSVPGAVTDRSGRVWVYFLYFGDFWSPVPSSPEEMERPYVFFELEDGSISEIVEVTFFPAQDEVDPDYPLSFYNDPDPELMPLEGEPGYCPAETVVPME